MGTWAVSRSRLLKITLRVNIRVHIFLLISVWGFLGYIPRNGLTGSKGSSMIELPWVFEDTDSFLEELAHGHTAANKQQELETGSVHSTSTFFPLHQATFH